MASRAANSTTGVGITDATATSVSARPRAVATTPGYESHSPRASSQAYYWTLEWQQRERLADFDLLIGGDAVYKPADIPDLLRWLHEG